MKLAIQRIEKKMIRAWVFTIELWNTQTIYLFSVCVNEGQDRLPTMYWLPKLHKRPHKARFIANSSSCSTTELSKLLSSCLTAIKSRQYMKLQIKIGFERARICNKSSFVWSFVKLR